MTTFESVTLTCPLCTHEVQARVLMSTNFMGSTTDLHSITSGYNPLEFMIHTCQHCGFTGSEPAFSGNIDPKVAQQIDQQIKPHVGDERLKADARWGFAARIAEWRGHHPEEIGQLYLNAAWCAEELEKEHFYRRKAADWFEQALAVGVKDRPVILYLIGELYRRVGDKSVADEWFDAAINEAEGHPDAERIREIAHQQKTNPKDKL
jgi:uncharacterized protein (DUF2225 family)